MGDRIVFYPPISLTISSQYDRFIQERKYYAPERRFLVSYLFAGSRRHIISDMVTNKRRVFYKMGKVMPLSKIPVEQFKSFLVDKFSRTGFSVEAGVLDEILDVTENYPYNVQFLCPELWNNCLGKRKVTVDDITPTMNGILDGQSAVYATIGNTLPRHQKRMVIAIAVSGGEKIFSRDF
jgi:hypothetical protein